MFRNYLALAGIIVMVLLCAQLIIILMPSRPSLMLGLILVFGGLGLYIRSLYRNAIRSDNRHRVIGSLLSIIVFLSVTAITVELSQRGLLYGYKAVNNDMAPTLIDGDHYFADRGIFRFKGLVKDDVYIVKDQQHELQMWRLVSLPGEMIESNGQPYILKGSEYGFASGTNMDSPSIIPEENILAHALLIYGSYDSATGTNSWNRIGLPVR